MTTLIPETKAVGPCLAGLQSVIEDKQAAVEWLVIAHNDPLMMRRLAEVVDEESAAMLQIPQDKWQMDGFALPEAVKWAICQAGIKHLLLVGHSKAVATQQTGSPINGGFAATSLGNARQSSYDRLLQGAKSVQDQIAQSKDHFAEQMAHLCEIEEVVDALSDGRLHLHTLFYVAQSGTFLLFDLVNQQFEVIDG